MLMLRRTHERIVQEKNIAAIKFVEYHRNMVAKLQATIEESNREIASLRRSAALDKLAEIDSEEIDSMRGPVKVRSRKS